MSIRGHSDDEEDGVKRFVWRGSFTQSIILVLVLYVLSACGGSSASAAEKKHKKKPTPTATATITSTPTRTATPTPTATSTSTTSASWNLYNNYSGYYAVPYASPTPEFGTQGFANPQINVQIAVPDSTTTIELSPTLDTGSRGMWVTADHFAANFPPSAQATPGYIFYWSSGNQLLGNWTNLPVTFPDAQAFSGAPSPAVAMVPVLIANQFCALEGNWPNGTRSVTTCSTPSSGSMMGIGFDRTGYGTCPEINPPPPRTDPFTPTCTPGLPVANQNYNPMLNLSAMQNGEMVSGYILTPEGVVLGLTPADTAPVLPSPPNTYAYQKLIPTGQVQIAPSPPDWQVATGSVILNGTAYPTGEGIFDIGIDDMLLTLPGFPTTGNLADSNQLEMALLGLPAGTVGYSFTVGDASNTLGPTSVQWSALQPGAFSEGQTLFTLVNTGRDVMNAFNVLYDASNGYLGLQLNNLSGGSSAFLTPTIGANGTMMFPDGFTTNLPMNLLSNTTISTGGTVTFNGPLTGSGALTVMGGTVNLNCTNNLPLIVVTQGALVVGGSVSGPVTTQGIGTVQYTPNAQCGSL
jgi:subtilase-type serine protease